MPPVHPTQRQKRVLVTGINGQVGRALASELQGQCELITSTRAGEGASIALDLQDHSGLKHALAELKPDIIISPAAYTAVDKAEQESEIAHAINGVAPGIMAEVSKQLGTTLIHYSTDYVFDGNSDEPYKESDATKPVNIYGASKLAGEQAIQAVDCQHLIFRVCWVYDAYGKNIPNAILARARQQEQLRVVNDQRSACSGRP